MKSIKAMIFDNVSFSNFAGARRPANGNRIIIDVCVANVEIFS